MQLNKPAATLINYIVVLIANAANVCFFTDKFPHLLRTIYYNKKIESSEIRQLVRGPILRQELTSDGTTCTGVGH